MSTAAGQFPPLLLWGSFAVIVAATGIPLWMNNRRLQRRIYWGGWVIGIVGIGVAVSYREGMRGFAVSVVTLALASVVMAVRNGPFLKIGGRIIATSRFDRWPDPSDTPDEPGKARRWSMPLTADAVRRGGTPAHMTNRASVTSVIWVS